MIPSCILLDPATKGDLQAACVQAEATVQAGVLQAAATNSAAFLTICAALIAFAAAVLGSYVTIQNTRKQIGATRKDVKKQLRAAVAGQTQQRCHDLKTEVYIPAMKAVSTGLFVATKLADVRIPVDVALASHQERLPELFAVHLVAELETGAKLLSAVHALQELQLSLIWEAVAIRATPPTVEQLINWARRCNDEVEKAIPATVAFVAAMRSELGVPTDEEKYADLIRRAMRVALARNEQAFNEIVAKRGGQGVA